MSAHDQVNNLPKIECASIDDWLLDGELDNIARSKLKLNGEHSKPPCDCPECLIHGERVRMPEQHDCEYVRARSKLVVIALVNTTDKIGDPQGDVKRGMKWTAEFVRQMESLSAPLLKTITCGAAQNQSNCNHHNGTKAREENGARAATNGMQSCQQ
jgi:hypothetical protein